VPNAVDTKRFSPGDKIAAKAKVGAPIGQPLALMLANLAPHKGQETAIRAMGLLKQRGIEMSCWLAGSERGGATNYTKELVALVRDLDVADRVQLLGQRSDAPDLLRAADFFLLPSTNEGLPLSIVEAQATKVPVLAAPTAGVPEVVRDDETGFLIPAGDSAAYALRMEALLAHPDVVHRITDAAYAAIVKEYSMSSFCERVWQLYRELLSRPGRTHLGWFSRHQSVETIPMSSRDMAP
jgi:glycosyltransferase involved in cell wall biosynthesis